MRVTIPQQCALLFLLSLLLNGGIIQALILQPASRLSSSTAKNAPISSLTTRYTKQFDDTDDAWESDFDDFGGDTIGGGSGGGDSSSTGSEGSLQQLSDMIRSQGAQDLSSCRVRQVRSMSFCV